MEKDLNFNKEEALHQWTSFPFIDRPIHSVVLCMIIALVTYILWQLTIIQWDAPLYYFLGVFILLIGIMPYFIPTSYFFFEKGILVQYPIVKIEKLYKDFGCFYADKMGIMLSPYKKPRRIDTFRGQSIRFSKSQIERPEIIAFLKEKIGNVY